MVYREKPHSIKRGGKELKISGFLASYYTPSNFIEVIEDVGSTHGGGDYVVRIIDPEGKFVKTKSFSISGAILLPSKPCTCSIQTLLTQGCQLPGVHI